MSTFLSFLVFVLLFVLLPIAMVRGLIRSWRDRDRRSSGSGGLIGAMAEIDRIVRPSVEHVLDAKKKIDVRPNDHGGE